MVDSVSHSVRDRESRRRSRGADDCPSGLERPGPVAFVSYRFGGHDRWSLRRTSGGALRGLRFARRSAVRAHSRRVPREDNPQHDPRRVSGRSVERARRTAHTFATDPSNRPGAPRNIVVALTNRLNGGICPIRSRVPGLRRYGARPSSSGMGSDRFSTITMVAARSRTRPPSGSRPLRHPFAIHRLARDM